MYTIASLLDIHSDQKIQILWKDLEEKCFLRGIKLTPLPHISWQASDNYQLEKADACLEEFARHHKPFKIRTTGLGLFTGGKNILYLAMVQSVHLTKLHKALWNNPGLTANRHYYYAPDYWVPHITLANKDVDQQKISCAIETLADETLDFTISVTSMAILYDNQGELGVKSIYKFMGSANNNRV